MNLFQLILKQMRQRALSTWLTCLSIFLGMTLATSVLVLGRESRALFAQTDYGFNVLIGPKGSATQLVMNTIYHVGDSPGNIPYSIYEDLTSGSETSVSGGKNEFHGLASWAVPFAVGDSYQGRRIVATTPHFFGVDDQGQALPPERTPHFRGDETFSFAQGRPFAPAKFEAVIGSEVAEACHLKMGDVFQATHGFPKPEDVPDIHPQRWTVVGILNETHTANDKCLFIPLPTFYAIFEHEKGEKDIAEIHAATAPATTAPATTAAATVPAPADQEGYDEDPVTHVVTPRLPKADWQVSAIEVKCPGGQPMLQMNFVLRNMPDAMGINPAQVMGEFFDTTLSRVSDVMILISVLVTILATISILVSIYNAVTARYREIAIMRALGATKGRILAVVCLEAGTVGLIGAVAGLIAGHLLMAPASWYLHRLMGAGIAWWRVGISEAGYLLGVVAVSLLAGLVPALKAYGTPVAENLVAS